MLPEAEFKQSRALSADVSSYTIKTYRASEALKLTGESNEP
jgi:hypothetical protein